MLHPSYGELIEKINEVNEEKGLPPINSRYSVVIAAARRARAVVDGDRVMISDKDADRSALSKVVEEMESGKIGISFDPIDAEEKTIQFENLSVVDFSRDMEEEE